MYLLVVLTQVTLYGAVGGVVTALIILSLAGRWDLWNVWAYVGILTILFSYHIVAGLDHRLHWSDIVPPGGVIAGLAIVIIGLALLIWAMLVNPFFSGAIRIQADRGQRVIREGPCALLRHPGHAGRILAFVAGGLALKSLISIIPVLVIMVPIVIYRTIVEDQMRRDELEARSGEAYREYKNRVPRWFGKMRR